MDQDFADRLKKQLPRRALPRNEAVAMVRSAMREAFPDLEFSMRDRDQDTLHENFEPPNLIVGWTDGPTREQVNRIIGRFSGPGWAIDQEGHHTFRFVDDERSVHEPIPKIIFQRRYGRDAMDEAVGQDYDQQFPNSYAIYGNVRPAGHALLGDGITDADRARVYQALEARSYMPTQPSPTAARVKVLGEGEVRALVERQELREYTQQLAQEQQQVAPVAAGRRRL